MTERGRSGGGHRYVAGKFLIVARYGQDAQDLTRAIAEALATAAGQDEQDCLWHGGVSVETIEGAWRWLGVAEAPRDDTPKPPKEGLVEDLADADD